MLATDCKRVRSLEGTPEYEAEVEKLKKKAAKAIHREQDWNSNALARMLDNRSRRVIKDRAPYHRMIFALYALAQTVHFLQGKTAVEAIDKITLAR